MRIYWIILLVSALVLVGATSLPRTPYVMRAGILYRVDAGGAPQRVSSQEVFTQRGQKYAVCLTETKPQHQTYLLLLHGDSAGRYTVVHQVRSAEVDATNAIMAVKVLDDDRVFLDLHINPSTGVGVELNTRMLRHETYVGCRFTWDSARRRLAYFDNGPHFGPRGACPGAVWVGHKRVKSLPEKVVTDVRWKGDGQLAVTLKGMTGESKTISLRP